MCFSTLKPICWGYVEKIYHNKY
uniref:Uncharacterized protein n=1 Tax=Rhizophora mucronata TaxID=61149 RepID=A0A2P2LXY8_RHIMU